MYMYICICIYLSIYIYIYSYICIYIYSYMCISDIYIYVYIYIYTYVHIYMCVYIGSFFGTFSLPLGTPIYMHKNISIYSFVNICIAPQDAHYHASVNCWTSAHKTHNMPASCCPGTRNLKPRTRIPNRQTWNPKPEARNLKPGLFFDFRAFLAKIGRISSKIGQFPARRVNI